MNTIYKAISLLLSYPTRELQLAVPELVALHYTSKMLRLIETLHWHGKILVRNLKETI